MECNITEGGRRRAGGGGRDHGGGGGSRGEEKEENEKEDEGEDNGGGRGVGVRDLNYNSWPRSSGESLANEAGARLTQRYRAHREKPAG